MPKGYWVVSGDVTDPERVQGVRGGYPRPRVVYLHATDNAGALQFGQLGPMIRLWHRPRYRKG